MVFEDNAGGESKAYIIGSDGRGLHQIGPVEGAIATMVWAVDGKSIYISTLKPAARVTPTVWKVNADGSNVEKVADGCFAFDAAPAGKYLLATGAEQGICEISIADKICIPLLPGVVTMSIHSARDGKSFLYPVAAREGVTFYRQAWRDGKVIGKPEVALELPFTFPLFFRGNAYDFSRDLATIVYARPGGQADLYLLSSN